MDTSAPKQRLLRGADVGFATRIANADLSTIYLLICCVAATALAFLTPPFWVQDEQDHFFRAYQLSEFELLGSVRDGTLGAVLPEPLYKVSLPFVQSGRADPFVVADVVALARIPLEPGRRRFLDLTYYGTRPPLAYAPQIAAIWFGRALGFGPLELFHAARLANCLAALLLVALALRLIPTGTPTLFALAAMPAPLTLFASVSPDAMTIAAMIAFTALAVRASFRGRWTPGAFAAAAALATVACMHRPTYAPLLLIGLPAVFHDARRLRTLAATAGLTLIAVGCSILWLRYAATLGAPPREGSDQSAQLARLMEHPLEFLGIVVATFQSQLGWWSREFAGMLAGHTPMPFIMYVPPALAVLASTAGGVGAARPTRFEAVWFALLMLGVLALTLLVFHVTWTPPGKEIIEGIQARYFLPLTALAAVALARLRWGTGMAATRVRGVVIGLTAAEAGLLLLIAAIYYWRL